MDKDVELGRSEQMDDEERLHSVQQELSMVERDSSSPELEEASEEIVILDIALHATAQAQYCMVKKATQTAITSNDISVLFASYLANCQASVCQYTQIHHFLSLILTNVL